MANFLRKRWQAWLRKRLPRSDSRTFNQKNLFILPTGAGAMFCILLLAMLVTGINYQNSLIYLVTFLLGAIFVGTMHQTHRNLSGVRLDLIHAGEGVAGEAVPFRFRLSAGSDDAVAIALSGEGSDTVTSHIPAGEFRDLVLRIPSSERGYLRPDRIRIETRYPFGLLKAWSWIRPSSHGLVFPRAIPVADVVSSLGDDDASHRSLPVSGQDHVELRPWREGDLSQRVQWKRFARNEQMVVADWEAETGSPLWLDYSAFPGVDRERRLGHLAWLVGERGRAGVRFGLSLPGQVLAPDAGPQHVLQCLRALAVWGKTLPAGESGDSVGDIPAGARASGGGK